MQAELQHLRTVERPEVVNRVATARELGDLRENAEYQAAKEKQAFSMTRLRELRERVRGAEVVKPRDFPDDIVTLLKRVKVSELNMWKFIIPLSGVLLVGAVVAIGLFGFGGALNDLLDARHDSAFSPNPAETGRMPSSAPRTVSPKSPPRPKECSQSAPGTRVEA